MKKIFLKKLLIVFSAGFLFTYGAIYACGGWDWDADQSETTNFTPETFVDKAFHPLFVSEDLFYSNFDLGDSSRFDEGIFVDWKNFLGGKMTDDQIGFFFSDSTAVQTLNALDSYYTTKKKNPVFDKWNKKIDLKDNKVKEFIVFFNLARQVELVSVSNYRDWEYNVPQGKIFDSAKLQLRLQSIYKNTPNEFLRNRYWFQIIKAYFYSEEQQKAFAFFDSTKNEVPRNTLYYRAIGYLAGIQYQHKKYAESNYLYSQVFDKCPQLMDIAVFNFHPQEQKDWNGSLAMAKTSDEKVPLWALQGYYADEEEAIRQIFELNPKSNFLEFLLARLVNHEELKCNQSFKDVTVIQNKKAIKDSINPSVIALVDKIAQSEKTSKPYLWNIAAGYLQTLDGNFKNAEAYFDKTEKQMPASDLAVKQLRLFRFINNLSKIDNLTAKKELELLPDLIWLYQSFGSNNSGDESVFRYDNASNWSKKYIAALYRAKQNVVMAEIFDRSDNFYGNPKNRIAMKAFLSKKEPTEYEKMAVKIYNVNIYDIYRYESVWAAFANKIPEALASMQKNNGFQNEILLGNPFNGSIQDCHDCDHQAYQKRKYTMLEYLQTINVMQAKLLKKEDIYTNSILLGNAFYNMTHYGNARIFHEGNIFGYASYPSDFSPHSRAIATNCSVAKMYYENALAAAATKEQKAKCYYMLAKCERNLFYTNKFKNLSNWYEMDDDGINFLEWNGFKMLKTQYADTRYYKEVIAECGYFSTYVNK